MKNDRHSVGVGLLAIAGFGSTSRRMVPLLGGESAAREPDAR